MTYPYTRAARGSDEHGLSWTPGIKTHSQDDVSSTP